MKKRYKDFRRAIKEELTVEVKPLPSKFTEEDVAAVKNALGLEFVALPELVKSTSRQPNQLCPTQLLKGLTVELEHIDVTNGDLLLTAKIALAHLRELPDYYDRLEKMEKGK